MTKHTRQRPRTQTLTTSYRSPFHPWPALAWRGIAWRGDAWCQSTRSRPVWDPALYKPSLVVATQAQVSSETSSLQGEYKEQSGGVEDTEGVWGGVLFHKTLANRIKLTTITTAAAAAAAAAAAGRQQQQQQQQQQQTPRFRTLFAKVITKRHKAQQITSR